MSFQLPAIQKLCQDDSQRLMLYTSLHHCLEKVELCMPTCATALSDYEYIARNNGLQRAPEMDFHYETKAIKVMVDFKFDALYRYVFIESLLKSG